MIYSDNIFDNFFKVDYTNFLNNLPGEILSSLIVVLIISIIMIVMACKARRADPLKKPKGLLFVGETLVNFFDGLTEELMGYRFKKFSAFFMAIGMYLFVSFIFGLTGLPSPMTNLAVPLTFALISFTLVHATAVKYNKFGYFKRFIDPLPIMLPINLITMWAPLLSWALRMFGNAIAGWVLMNIVYYAFEGLSASIFSAMGGPWNQVFIAPFLTPILHCYFDLFSGFIQTTIFLFLSMLNIAAEAPEEF